MKHIVIIGNGISGITAARQIRKKSDLHITVISYESKYFFSRTALMYVYMGHMRFDHTQPYENGFWQKNHIELEQHKVKQVDTGRKFLLMDDNRRINYDILVLATGSTSNKFGWMGQDLSGVHGMYSKQDIESLENSSENAKQAVIVGGGLIGIEMAEMFHSRNIHVTMLVRESSYWNAVLPPEESQMINRLILEHGIDLRLNTELKSIIDDGAGKVKSIIASTGEEVACQIVGLTVGVSPNIEFLVGSGVETNRGILVDEFLETNINDVYAIGDCAQHRKPPFFRKPVEQVWYTGRIMGETLAETICGNRTPYRPGNWFNSAKFFTVEYQTYGWVWSKLKENENTLLWEDKNANKLLRFSYDKNSRQFLGVNCFGIRLRHEVMDKWLSEENTIDFVVQNLRTGLFDPELYHTLNTVKINAV